MATVKLMGKGFSGTIGNVVFRSYNGKTYVSVKPSLKSKRRRTQSPLQEFHRNRFQYAAFEAKAMLRDSATREKYTKRARKLKLPNAYTLAIKEIMSRPYK
jgi:hypothetical protein